MGPAVEGLRLVFLGLVALRGFEVGSGFLGEEPLEDRGEPMKSSLNVSCPIRVRARVRELQELGIWFRFRVRENDLKETLIDDVSSFAKGSNGGSSSLSLALSLPSSGSRGNCGGLGLACI